MVGILVRFDTVVGPKVIMVYPDVDELKENYGHFKFIEKLLDMNNDKEGFFLAEDETEDDDEMLRSINYLFYLPSPSNMRGGVEIMLFSYLITEEMPNIEHYKENITSTITNIKAIPENWKAFYKTDGSEKVYDAVFEEING